MQIEELWNNLNLTTQEREKFSAYSSFEYTEEILATHVDYLQSLGTQYENSKPIFAMIVRRTYLRDQQNELDNQRSDPKRLLNKRSGTLLLQEEKLWQTIARELPTVEKKLVVALEEWPAQYDGKPFIYMGINYLQKIKEDQAQEERIKQELKDQKERQRLERLGISNDQNAFRTPQKLPPKQPKNASETQGTFVVPAKTIRTPQSSAKQGTEYSKQTTPKHTPKNTVQKPTPQQMAPKTTPKHTLVRVPTPRPLRVHPQNTVDKSEKQENLKQSSLSQTEEITITDE